MKIRWRPPNFQGGILRIAMEDLRLDRLDVVHAGEQSFLLAERIRALALGRLWEDLEPWT